MKTIKLIVVATIIIFTGCSGCSGCNSIPNKDKYPITNGLDPVTEQQVPNVKNSK